MAGDPRMPDNPFQSPSGDARIVGTRGGSLQELKNVAKYQRGVLLCLLAQILGGVGVVFLAPLLPPTALLLYNLALFSLGIISTVFVFLLASNVYPSWAGPVLGILTLVPCIGLAVLLIVNAKATAVLRQNGVRVGFLGANPSQL